MTQFVLKIELGNEAMQTSFDIAELLEKSAIELRTTHIGLTQKRHLGMNKTLCDSNGNIVGYYTVVNE